MLFVSNNKKLKVEYLQNKQVKMLKLKNTYSKHPKFFFFM